VKIGIITLHGENNYGAALQAVALKNVLNKFAATKIINYSSTYGSLPFSSIFMSNEDIARREISHTMFSLLAKGNNPSKVFEPIIRIHKFKDFMQTYGNLTEPYTYEQLINNEMEPFDVYVSGSDQIWNPKLTGLDPVFFSSYALPGAKKISYASSIGGHKFNTDEAAIMKQHLSSFSHISTREENAALILEDITGREVDCVLDPTLLLNKEQWVKLLRITKRSDRYVLVYNMSMNSLIFKIACSIARAKGLRIYNVTNWYRIRDIADSREYLDEIFIGAGPVDFLELIYNSSFIVTDSFHGTAFSVNFNKPFISVMPQSAPGRVAGLLDMLGLRGRLVHNVDEFKEVNIDLNIDYETVNMLLEKQRGKSMSFIRNALGITSNLEEF